MVRQATGIHQAHLLRKVITEPLVFQIIQEVVAVLLLLEVVQVAEMAQHHLFLEPQ